MSTKGVVQGGPELLPNNSKPKLRFCISSSAKLSSVSVQILYFLVQYTAYYQSSEMSMLLLLAFSID